MVDRRVHGTYLGVEDAVRSVHRLMEEEGFQQDEMMLVANEDEAIREQLTALSPVRTEFVTPSQESSFIETIKEFISFGSYESNDYEDALETYDVNDWRSERFDEALDAGEIILLVTSGAPRNPGELSEVNKQVMDEEPL